MAKTIYIVSQYDIRYNADVLTPVRKQGRHWKQIGDASVVVSVDRWRALHPNVQIIKLHICSDRLIRDSFYKTSPPCRGSVSKRSWTNWTGGARTLIVDTLLPCAAALALVAIVGALVWISIIL